MRRRRTDTVWPVMLLWALTGCAPTAFEPSLPSIETYLPAETRHLDEQKAPPSGEPGPSPSPAAAGPVTLEGCVRIALADNPVVQASREGVAAAREAVGEAWSGHYPHVDLSAGYRRWESHAFLPRGLGGTIGAPPDTVGPTHDWSGGLTAGLTLFDGGRRRAAILAAKARWGASREDAAALEQDIALAVHQAFYSLLSAEDALRVARENLARAEDHLRLAQERKEAGVAVQADVLRAQVEVADRRLAIVRVGNLVRIAKGNLNTTMGLPADMPIEVQAAEPEIVPPDEAQLAAAFDQAVRRRPELQAALNRIAGARSDVAAAESAFGPQVNAGARYGRRDAGFWPEDEDWSVGVAVELPLFAGFSRTHRLRRANRELSQEEAQTRSLVLAVRQEVWTAHSRVKEAYEALQATQVLVADARESMDLTRQRYEAGTNTITDLLDAQAALARAEGVQVEARWNYFISRAALDRATGHLAAHAPRTQRLGIAQQ